jgi:hypothetical protein
MIESLAFYGSLVVFCLPGSLAASILFPRARNPIFLVPAGFVISLAILAAVAWPCLWLRAQATTFWGLLAVAWVAFLAASLRALPKIRGGWRPEADEEVAEAPAPTTAQVEGGWSGRVVSVLLIAYLAWAAVVSYGLLRRLSVSPEQAWPDWFLLAACLGIGAAGAPELARARRRLGGPSPGAAPSPLWTYAAMGMIASLAVGVALQARPDWDDGEYLADVLRYSEGGTLNRECATLPGEGLLAAPHMRLLAWELFGATLCRASGVHPMVSHRTLLPPLLLLMAFAVHWELLAELLLPRRLVPLAILALGVYWAFGISAYNSAGNLLLTRPWQGKTMLLHLGLPLEILALARFLAAPSIRSWLCCLLMATGALAMSSSAVYMLACLVPAFCLAMAIGGGDFKRWKIYVAAGASAGPIVIYGLLLRSAMAAHPFLLARPAGDSWRSGLSIGAKQSGDFGLFWILALPISAALLPSRRGRSLLLGMPLILSLTAMNPAAYTWVSGHLTSCWTYRRLFWLFPVGLGLAAAVALVADFVAASWATTAVRARAAGLAIALGLAIGSFALPGCYVWGPDNVGPYPGLEPAWGENPLKVPRDLLVIIREAARDGGAPGRLLFAEHLCPFVVPYSSRFRFVSSRPSYTYESLAEAGREAEGLERVSLAASLLGFRGTAPEYFGDSLLKFEDRDDEARSLLEKYDVHFIITDDKTRIEPARLNRLGFRLFLGRGKYRLWARPSDGPGLALSPPPG